MKKSTQAMMIALALGLSGFAAVAQPSDAPSGGERPPHDGPPGGPGRGGPKPPLLLALDADGDGIISAQEIANASAALKALDKNGDGQLTQDELRPKGMGRRGPGQGGPDGQGAGPDGSDGGQRPPPGDRPTREGGPGQDGGRPPMPPLIAALDANGDGIISADEIANASAALLKLDKNGDGQLTPDEYRPMGMGPGGPDGAGRQGHGHRPPPGGGNQPPQGQQ
jgi:hypothetical protein